MFIELESKWYSKLKDTGFEDIEDYSRKDRPLKTWHSFKFLSVKQTYETGKKYYERAAEILSDFDFLNSDHRKVWALHSEGIPEREIAKQVRYKKSMVHHVIDLIARENGLKK